MKKDLRFFCKLFTSTFTLSAFTFGGGYVIIPMMRRKFVDREVDSANEIVEFDLLDVRNADIILVNYSRPSIGTSMEVFYASHVLGKFVVAFSPYEYRECSPWMVRYCTKILGSLEEAAEYIATHFSQEME